MTALTFVVEGVPATQGSLDPYPIYAAYGCASCRFTGKVGVSDSSPRLAGWRSTIAFHARDAAQQQGLNAPLPDAVQVDLGFRLPRPKSHYRTGKSTSDLLASSAPAFPIVKKNDLDKLVRAVLDALTAARVWTDDGQVVSMSTRKVYALRGERTGVNITVQDIPTLQGRLLRGDYLAAETATVTGGVL